MDLTFEEVAHVIQDARFQQGIFDFDKPKPDRRIPQPPRGFNAEQFAIDEEININTLLSEPLGQYFLKSFCTNDREVRTMQFTEDIYNLRRQDPMGIVHATDILAMLDRHQLTLPEGSAGKEKEKEAGSQSSSSAAKEESTTASVEADKGNDPTQDVSAEVKDDDEDVPDKEDPTDIGRTGTDADHGTQGQQAPEAEPKSGLGEIPPSSYIPPTGGGGGGGSKVELTETNVSRYEDKQAEQLSNAPPLSTYAANFSTSVNTYGAAAALAVSRAAAGARIHTQRSINLNASINTIMESEARPIYERLREDKRSFAYYCKLKWFSKQPVNDKQIRYHRVLGIGAFGTVNGCIIASLGCMLAMKTMLKKKIKAKRARSQVVAERQALETLAAHPSPYCMRLRYAYQTKEAFHLILPLAVAGDLKYHLRDKPFDPERARVYAAEVALGLGHIHSLGLVIRDLKPRNILLNSKGRCQISDLGLAVSIADGRTIRGRAGTEGYWSPEVINNLNYSIDADWWSYGCCVFEFLAGFSPFSCKHTGLKTRNEGTRKAKIRYPKSFPEDAKPLINALLNRKSTERLGCKGRGVFEVLNEKHEYWKNIDIDQVRRNEHDAPWLPEKGVIYALPQGEIQDNDDLELRKVRLTPEDKIDFPSFTDYEDHQRDIVKVLQSTSLNTHRASVGPNSSGLVSPPPEQESGSCCSVA